MAKIDIRGFELKDREAVRRISCETSFLEEDRRLFIDDDEILADALTAYYTDQEPGSCFVAVSDGAVVGYIIGTKDARRMEKIFARQILIKLIRKAFCRGLFGKMSTWRLFFQIIVSALKGEFFAPIFLDEYPAMLHINIDKCCRGQAIGRSLVERYIGYLKSQGVNGVHFGTMSDRAKIFFMRSGFKLLHASKRSYLKYRTGKDVPFYILGMRLSN